MNGPPTASVITRVRFPDVADTLEFSYGVFDAGAGLSRECVLTTIEGHRADGGVSPLAFYEYRSVLGHPELARVLDAPGQSVKESYDYGDAGFEFTVFRGDSANPTPAVRHVLNPTGGITPPFRVVSSSAGGPERTSVVLGVEKDPEVDLCPVANSCCPSQVAWRNSTINELTSSGGSSSSLVSGSSTYTLLGGFEMSLHDALLIRREDADTGGSGAVVPGTVDYHYLTTDGGASNCSNGAIATLWAVKNKADDFVVTPKRLIMPDAGPALAAVETTSRLLGASSVSGTGALQSSAFGYSYGSSSQQRLVTTTRASTIQSGNSAVSTQRYAGDRIDATFESGWTRNISGTASQRVVGTFYKTQRACDASSADSLNRTLRVEGPCVVSNETATGCTGTFAVTEYYYDSGAGGRLSRVARYPSNTGTTCGSALNTYYSDYTVTGLPGQVVDESGATRLFEYAVDRVTKETLVMSGGNRVTEYFYDSGRLSKVKYPRGNVEFFCYRTGASDSCTGGESTPLLQWKAKADGSSNWSERIEYDYWPDDGLKRETHKTAGGDIRLMKSYSRNAHQQLTFEQTGIGSNRTKRAFDGNGNVIAIGLPFSAAPDFCAT
jgi:hypothetical protein